MSAPDEHGKIAKALDDWRERAVDAVLGAYHERLTDPRLWPQDRGKADRLLDFFLLEKVFYEIEYEMSYRPDWVRVPVRGALRILMRQEALAA
jgi:maltose alpha-D-glucosyltransferase/alpha-amylase